MQKRVLSFLLLLALSVVFCAATINGTHTIHSNPRMSFFLYLSILFV